MSKTDKAHMAHTKLNNQEFQKLRNSPAHGSLSLLSVRVRPMPT